MKGTHLKLLSRDPTRRPAVTVNTSKGWASVPDPGNMAGVTSGIVPGKTFIFGDHSRPFLVCSSGANPPVFTAETYVSKFDSATVQDTPSRPSLAAQFTPPPKTDEAKLATRRARRARQRRSRRLRSLQDQTTVLNAVVEKTKAEKAVAKVQQTRPVSEKKAGKTPVLPGSDGKKTAGPSRQRRRILRALQRGEYVLPDEAAEAFSRAATPTG